MHKALKNKNWKYLVRIYWLIDKVKYQNAKYMYSWYLIEV